MIKNKYLQHKETIHNFFWRALQIGGKQGTIFLIFILAANFLLPIEFGIFNYLMAILALLIIFCDFGISTATSKHVAEYNTNKSRDLDKILFSMSLIIIIISTIISLFIILFGKPFLGENYRYLLYFLPYLFLVPLSSVIDGVYRGMNEFKLLSIISFIVGIISLIISYFLIKNYFLVGAIISQNILYFLLVLFLFLFKKNWNIKVDKKIIKQIIRYSLIIGLTSIVYYMYSKADILILKHFGYILEIGYYEIVNKFFQILLIPSIILGQVIAPNMTKIYANKEYSLVKKKFLNHLGIFCIVGIAGATILYFIFPFLVEFFTNKYFLPETIIIFNILIFLFPLRILAGVISQGHTIATGNAHLSLWTMLPAGIGNVILDFYFIEKFGFIGVVYSTVICYSFAIISFITLYYLKLSRLSKK